MREESGGEMGVGRWERAGVDGRGEVGEERREGRSTHVAVGVVSQYGGVRPRYQAKHTDPRQRGQAESVTGYVSSRVNYLTREPVHGSTIKSVN